MCRDTLSLNILKDCDNTSRLFCSEMLIQVGEQRWSYRWTGTAAAPQKREKKEEKESIDRTGWE